MLEVAAVKGESKRAFVFTVPIALYLLAQVYNVLPTAVCYKYDGRKREK